MVRVYCAGPLFNDPEKREMADIADVLSHAGFSTFLPQRDGLEHAKLQPEFERLGIPTGEAQDVLHRAIFTLDVYELLSCQAVVANLNGRVPDEGTVVEASLAWYSGKALVLYKRDNRSVLGGSDNPMLTGLGDFSIVSQITDLPAALQKQLETGAKGRVEQTFDVGKGIALILKERPALSKLAEFLHSQFKRKGGRR